MFVVTGTPYSSFMFLQKIDCVHNGAVMELMRGLRNQLTELITGLGAQDLGPMSLGLSHSLSRYKLKFSPEKVSLMPLLFRFLLNFSLFIIPSLVASYLFSSNTVFAHFAPCCTLMLLYI